MKKKGEVVVSKELQQFHNLSVFIPIEVNELRKEQCTAALASLIFLNEKKNGDSKAQACMDGRKQHETMAEASPTVSIESIFMTCCIEAKEKSDVAAMDSPGALLHLEYDDYVIMKFVG